MKRRMCMTNKLSHQYIFDKPSGATGAGLSRECSKGSKVSLDEEPEIMKSEVKNHTHVCCAFVQALSEWWSLNYCCYSPILS